MNWRRQLLVMLVITATMLGLAILLAAARGASVQSVGVTVAPNEVDRYEAFVVTVSTAFPNTTFQLTLSGPSYVLERNGTTNWVGLWEDRLSAPDFGRYSILVAALGETAETTLTVGCGPRCVVEIQNSWGQYVSALVAAGLFQIIIVVVILLLAVEGPRTAHYVWKNGVQAVKHGQLTLGDRLKSPLAIFHGFVQPGRQSMRLDVNDRIALDLERRARQEELHEATRSRFLEYDPGHLSALREIFSDLELAYDREARVIGSAPPVAHPYEREVEDVIEQTAEWIESETARPAAPKKASNLQDVIDAHLQRQRRTPYRVAAAIWILAGLPALLMAILAPLATSGIYIEALRPLWRPWFGDDGKLILGIAIFAMTTVALIWTRARAKTLEG